MHIKLKPFSFSKFCLIGLLILLITSVVTVAISIPPVWHLNNKSIQLVRWPKSGETLVTIGPNFTGWVPIRSVSRHVLNAIVVAEDAKFYRHHGIDLTEVSNSLKINLAEGRYVRGGSTITQQVVKLAFLSREKSLFRKFREALGALVLEKILDKEGILEWYINLIEFGDGVYGIRQAAHHYFNTKPELLTIQEGANLALVIPGPNSWSIGLRNKNLTEFGHERFAQIINWMYENGLITSSLRLHAFATGDFGRPVKAYPEIFLDSKEGRDIQQFNNPTTPISKGEEPPQ